MAELEDPLEEEPTPVFLPGESHGQRSLAGYSLWGHRVRHGRVGIKGGSVSRRTEEPSAMPSSV